MTDSEDIPLDITGHEERDPPGADESQPATSETADSQPATSDTTTDEQLATDEQPATDEQTENPVIEESEEEVEPVEVLVQLARDGEIDPWDIDIVDVTDKFLARLDEADLRTSGRALFYASVLLRMKGDAMLADDEEEEPEPWERALAGEEPLDEPDPFDALDREMDRRLERKRARGMPQTLNELVRELREAERDSWWKKSREYDTSDSPEGYQRGTQEVDYRSADQFRMDDEPTENEVTGKTHGEDIEEIIDEVHTTVREQYDQGRKEVLFREVETTGGSRVETFLGLLFLSHRGQVRLRQDELFGDLWIQDPAAVAGSDEAIAD
jgi:segregation and condensation protein A